MLKLISLILLSIANLTILCCASNIQTGHGRGVMKMTNTAYYSQSAIWLVILFSHITLLLMGIAQVPLVSNNHLFPITHCQITHSINAHMSLFSICWQHDDYMSQNCCQTHTEYSC